MSSAPTTSLSELIGTSPQLGVNGERRRRNRLRSPTLGWVFPDGADAGLPEPWEVRVNDVSRFGVGFESTEQYGHGSVLRVRIGRGPLELAKRVRVVRCELGYGGVYSIGGEFVQ